MDDARAQLNEKLQAARAEMKNARGRFLMSVDEARKVLAAELASARAQIDAAGSEFASKMRS